MNLNQAYFNEVRQLLSYENFPQLTKRITGLAIDTDNVEMFGKTIQFIEWLEQSNPSDIQKREAFANILNALIDVLQNTVCPANKPLLVVENLIRSYPSSAFALGPISFVLHQGHIIGLVGENGNGKTTLLRCLCGELQPTSGLIRYSSVLENMPDLRSHLIYIPQRTPTWQGSLISNLQFTASFYGIYGLKNELMTELVIARMGLRKYKNYSWKNLSSGYKMRFELARALLRTPKLLLIDEPLANLDILAQQIVLDDLRDMASSPFHPVGIVLSSQQLYEVEKTSNQVLFLKNGTLMNARQDTDVAYREVSQFIIEFESAWNQEQLTEAFQKLGLERLQINGGTYVATFPDTMTMDKFMSKIVDQKIPLVYFRDISKSARRYFLS